MIIFDLDGTLADCEHRRHFVTAPEDVCNHCYDLLKVGTIHPNLKCEFCGRDPFNWKLDWQAFYQACDKDEPILPVVFIFFSLREKFGICHPIQIWSGRCESVKGKTIDWLQQHFTRDIDWVKNLKMRPFGDHTPDDQLKEKWLDEALSEGKTIDFVFDDRPKVVRMWRRNGIFVFDCNQTGEDF